MNVDLLGMNAFKVDDDDDDDAPLASDGAQQTKASDGSDSNAEMTTDFLQDDEVGLRDHSEARVLTPIVNPYNSAEKPKMNLVRDEGQDSFI